MSFFNHGEEKKTASVAVGSKYGKPVTSIELAKEELFYKPKREDPAPYIENAAAKNMNFYGLYHVGTRKGKPFYLPDAETTMEIYVGSTGTGKGVLLGNRALEAIKKGKGVIIIDPKTDAFLPKICQDELRRQGRPNDFQVVSWPDNFGYDGINEDDSYQNVANKLIDAFGLEETGDGGVDYYRKNERVMLKKVLKLFFDGSLGVVVKKELADILEHIIKLKEDLEKQELLDKELGKNKPNYNKMKELEKRFFNTDLVERIYWDKTTVDTLDSLTKSFGELLEAGNIFKKYDLAGALYEGKVIYFRVDMLDISSLKMVKLMINDAIQQARKKRANTIIIADELSFYANQTIAGALATVRSMGLKFLLALQDLAQMKDEHIRNAILSNCNVKMFYKISDKTTLEYVEKIGGKELVTKFSKSIEKGDTFSQDLEDYLNATKIRALPRQSVGIVIAEALPTAEIIQTNFVAVDEEFDWGKYEKPDSRISLADIEGEVKDRPKDYNYRTFVKDEKKLLENSELWAVEFGTEEL